MTQPTVSRGSYLFVFCLLVIPYYVVNKNEYIANALFAQNVPNVVCRLGSAQTCRRSSALQNLYSRGRGRGADKKGKRKVSK